MDMFPRDTCRATRVKIDPRRRRRRGRTKDGGRQEDGSQDVVINWDMFTVYLLR